MKKIFSDMISKIQVYRIDLIESERVFFVKAGAKKGIKYFSPTNYLLGVLHL